jgi:alkylation response protein AidB-like acyl-CoA dehydrogenase
MGGCGFPEHHGGGDGPDVVLLAALAVVAAAVLGALAVVLADVLTALLILAAVLSVAGSAAAVVLVFRGRRGLWRPGGALAEPERLGELPAAPARPAIATRAAAVVPGEVLSSRDETDPNRAAFAVMLAALESSRRPARGLPWRRRNWSE